MMRHASFFSGLGGFDLAAEWMGWQNSLHCEILEDKLKWLKYRFPESTSYADITAHSFLSHRDQIDILTGGDPCQVSSKIGKREGMEGQLWLWPHLFRVIGEIKPVCVVNENVDGTISNGILDRKITDLESIGYTCWPPLVIPASFCGASHRRDRVWIIAYLPERRLERRNRPAPQRQWETQIRPVTALVENQNGIIRPKPEFLQGNDGIPGWVDEIQGYGNAIVPQVAYEIFKLIDQFFSSRLSPLI